MKVKINRHAAKALKKMLEQEEAKEKCSEFTSQVFMGIMHIMI